MKEIQKQVEVGLNPQEGFTQVDKERDVKHGIRGQVMHLNSPSNKEGHGRNRKRKNRGPEEHEEGKQQIHFFPHEEKTPPQIHANESLSEVEEDDSQPDSKGGSRRTYSISTHGPPPHQQQPRPPSPLKQISSVPLE
jgi:hypothetical protein